MTTTRKKPAAADDGYGFQAAEQPKVTLPSHHPDSRRVDAPEPEGLQDNGKSVVILRSPAEREAHAKAEEAAAIQGRARAVVNPDAADLDSPVDQYVLTVTGEEVPLGEAFRLGIVARDPETGAVCRGNVKTPTGNSRFDNSPIEILTR